MHCSWTLKDKKVFFAHLGSVMVLLVSSYALSKVVYKLAEKQKPKTGFGTHVRHEFDMYNIIGIHKLLSSLVFYNLCGLDVKVVYLNPPVKNLMGMNRV